MSVLINSAKLIVTPEAIKKMIRRNMPFIIIFFALQLVIIPYVLFPAIDGITMMSAPNIPIIFLSVPITIGLRIMLYMNSLNAKKYRKDIEYGSARWGTPEDIRPFIDPDPRNNVILTKTESLTMNPRPSKPEFARNKNIMVIGGSGSGKTRFYVKPNLMQTESEKYPVSFVTTDPKGTILLEMGHFLEKQKYKIKVLNTIDFAKSHKYNPFKYIRSEKDILKFVTALIANTKGEGKGGDDFWVKAETLLYQALIGYIHYEASEHEKNINTLLNLINCMEVMEDDESHENAVDLMFKGIEYGAIKRNEDGSAELDENNQEIYITEKCGECPPTPNRAGTTKLQTCEKCGYIEPQPQHFALRQYKKYKQAAGKTAKSILISCGARLSPFDIAEVRELMSDDQLELDSLGGTHTGKIVRVKDKKVTIEQTRKRIKDKGIKGVEGVNWKWEYTNEKEIDKTKYALFVIISDTDATFNFIVSLMYSQLFNLLCDRADGLYY